MSEQNTQAVVLQQPNGEKLQVELKITQVADDTTAMKSFEKSADISIASFDSATIIAVSLALFATALAYWFGVRSFVLTKQSFNLTLEQIGKSVEQTLNSNKELYESQENLKLMEIRASHRQVWINSMRDISVKLFVLLKEVSHELNLLNDFVLEQKKLLPNFNLYDLEEGHTYSQKIFKIDEAGVEIGNTLIQLELYLDYENEDDKNILTMLDEIESLIWVMGTDCFEGKDTKDLSIKFSNIAKFLKKNMQNRIKVEWEIIKKGE